MYVYECGFAGSKTLLLHEKILKVKVHHAGESFICPARSAEDAQISHFANTNTSHTDFFSIIKLQ